MNLFTNIDDIMRADSEFDDFEDNFDLEDELEFWGVKSEDEIVEKLLEDAMNMECSRCKKVFSMYNLRWIGDEGICKNC